jgi:Fe-S-cluster containining protein
MSDSEDRAAMLRGLPEDADSAQETAKYHIGLITRLLPARLEELEATLCERIAAIDDDIEALREIYATVDELFKFVDQFTPCGRGCSLCCHYRVEISAIEAALIQQETGRKMRKRQREPRRVEGTPCPFLTEGACTIYEHRPLACRKFVSLARSPKWCAHDSTTALQRPEFTEVGRAIGELMVRTGKVARKDIRCFFD